MLITWVNVFYFPALLTNTITCSQKYLTKQSSTSLPASFLLYCAILKNSTIMSSRPASIGLLDVRPQRSALTCDAVCDRVCVFHACQSWMMLGSGCVYIHIYVCVSFFWHTSQGEAKDYSRADSAWLNAPLWTCLNGADCSNEAGQTRQSTCGRGTGERWKRLGWMCQSSAPGDKETLCQG